MPLKTARAWSWDGRTERWISLGENHMAIGRHCEVVISALRLATPQWTPLREQAPEWMTLGFSLFRILEGLGDVHEVFPTAAYRQFESDTEPRVELSFSGFSPGPKDMLDAVLAAVVVREYALGRGCAIGGGDGLGTIILPRKVDPARRPAVHRWPTSTP
jgi:predicted nuclease with RNAse H fold